MKKYKVLIEYSDGLNFEDEEFESLIEAVKLAQSRCYGSKFYIVKIIDWEIMDVIEK